MPSVSEQLYLRALRMLSDGNEHATAALVWATLTLRAYSGTAQHLLGLGFTPREISLGAMSWS